MCTKLLTLACTLLVLGLAPISMAAEPFRDCADCPLMVTVPAGSFQMGSSADDLVNAVREGAKLEKIENETPQHAVQIGQFAIATTEVTRDQFEAFVRDSGYQAGGPCWVYTPETKWVERSDVDWRRPGYFQSGDHPVVCISWNDAKAYVRWLSQKTGKAYRLPSEAEWEYAARANTSTARYWGTNNADACRYANVSDSAHTNWARINTDWPCTDGYIQTAPVAKFQANGFGLYDMLGNVWEWTEDCYNKSYNSAPTNGAAWLSGDCDIRINRGASWDNYVSSLRVAKRSSPKLTQRDSAVGFRVARSN